MTVKITKFDQPVIEATVSQVADHMPNGRAWEAKSVTGTNLHSQMHGTAKPFNMTQGRIEALAREFDINQTVELIGEWEASAGLPDACLGPVSGLELRRQLVIDRISNIPTVTLAEQQSLIDGLFPGLGVVLFPGDEFFGFEYALELFFLGNVSSKFILVAAVPGQVPFFEFDFEFAFTGGVNQTELQCILDRVVPANVVPLILEGIAL